MTNNYSKNVSPNNNLSIFFHKTLGNFSNAFIDLKNNSLTQLDSSVFTKILSQMNPKNKCGLDISERITEYFLI